MTKSKTIAFIGGGNMAHSLIGGMLKKGYDPTKIRVSDPHPEKLQALENHYGIKIAQTNKQAVASAEVVVLAVKPQSMQQVVNELADDFSRNHPLLISIAAGITVHALASWVGRAMAIVRCMPNTPAMVGSGATGLYSNTHTTPLQHEMAESIMRSVGLTIWLDDEAQLDIVTALSGSGPAYFFLVMEALQAAAEQAGLDASKARLLTVQTALGAARLALETDVEIAQLRQNVTSKGGTTEQGLSVLQEGDLHTLFARALEAARQRAVEMSQNYTN